jgi:hypothetical protein
VLHAVLALLVASDLEVDGCAVSSVEPDTALGAVSLEVFSYVAVADPASGPILLSWNGQLTKGHLP